MKNRLLIFGLVISLTSIVFNVFIYGYHNDQITSKEEELDFISYSNLYLSAEFNHAENIYFKSRLLEYELRKYLANEGNDKDSGRLKILEEDLTVTRIKATNYALNSSVDMVSTFYNTEDTSRLENIIHSVKSSGGIDIDQLKELKIEYEKYYLRHEGYIKTKMERKLKLRDEIKGLKRKNSWMKLIAISLQTIGLILVFLKDLKK